MRNENMYPGTDRARRTEKEKQVFRCLCNLGTSAHTEFLRVHKVMLWESPLYAVNTLANKESALDLLQCRLGQGGNSKQKQERVGRVKEKPCSLHKRQILDAGQNLTGRTQPCGKTQMNTNGLI